MRERQLIQAVTEVYRVDGTKLPGDAAVYGVMTTRALRIPCPGPASGSGSLAPAQQATTPGAPLADHHQHLFSPAIAALISPVPPAAPVVPITATDLIALPDAAGIRRAVVLSVAYIYGQPTRSV